MQRGRSSPQRAMQLLAVASMVGAAACASHRPYDRNTSQSRYEPRRDANGDVVNERHDDAGRYAHRAPPPDRAEPQPAQPGPQYVWVPGHYSWDGSDYQWHSGDWEMPPNGYHSWRPGHWDQTGPNNWVYTEGQWQ